MAYVVMSMTAEGHVDKAVHDFLDHTLGPLITADAIRYAPKRSGALKASIRYWVKDNTLYVGAFTGYAAYVELGHRVYHRFKRQIGPEVVPPEPYLRPALYKHRSAEMPDPPATYPVGTQHPRKFFQMLSFSDWYKKRYGYPKPREPMRLHIRGPTTYPPGARQ